MMFVSDHKVSEVICLRCLTRWQAARPVDTFLRDLECPRCHMQGFTIETGENLQESDMLMSVEEDGDGE